MTKEEAAILSGVGEQNKKRKDNKRVGRNDKKGISRSSKRRRKVVFGSIFRERKLLFLVSLWLPRVKKKQELVDFREDERTEE